MNRTIVTAFNKQLYKEYAFRFIETYKKYNIPCELIIYSENTLPREVTDNFKVINIFEEIPECSKFIERHHSKKKKHYLFDPVRFCYKVFAQCHASSILSRKMYWIDADCVFREHPPESWWDTFLEESFVSFYDRPGLYTECGFMAYNLDFNCSKMFFKVFKEFYISDRLFLLEAFSDCHAFDATRKLMKDYIDYSESPRNFYSESSRGLHVMAKDPFMAKYIDHCKGPRRKMLGRSKELVV